MESDNPRAVLFVDDEPAVLESLSDNLVGQFDVATASSGKAGLEILEKKGPFAVVVADHNMPGMDGATFLSHVKTVAPLTTRLLLTGASDLRVAIAAINEGQIFRFLQKPCPPPLLISTLEAASEQYRLVTAERVLLEQTLHGSIMAMTDVLALANPPAFGRATRLRERAGQLAERLGVADRWQIEVAAMLSQIGGMILPEETAEKLARGQVLGAGEQTLVARLPEVALQILARIPRLDSIREILRYQDKGFDGSGRPQDEVRGEKIPVGARILRLALDLDTLEAQGLPLAKAVETLKTRAGTYDPALLRALEVRPGAAQSAEMSMSAAGAAAAATATAEPIEEIKAVPIAALAAGMVLHEDLLNRDGKLLVARGHRITESSIDRISNFAAKAGVEKIRVLIGSVATPSSSDGEEDGSSQSADPAAKPAGEPTKPTRSWIRKLLDRPS
ncbi:MAG: HD domain-containing phosphohydrolase [Pseudomonadota bacterium]